MNKSYTLCYICQPNIKRKKLNKPNLKTDKLTSESWIFDVIIIIGLLQLIWHICSKVSCFYLLDRCSLFLKVLSSVNVRVQLLHSWIGCLAEYNGKASFYCIPATRFGWSPISLLPIHVSQAAGGNFFHQQGLPVAPFQ